MIFIENLIRNSTELKYLKMKSRNCLLWIYYLEVSSYLFDREFDSGTNIFGQYKVRIKVIRLIYDSLYTQGYQRWFGIRHFLKWQLPKWQLHKCAISQAATSHLYPSRSTRPPVCSSRGARCVSMKSLLFI